MIRYVSGCPHHCPSCFKERKVEHILDILCIQELALLGGEQLAIAMQSAILDLAQMEKERHPAEDIWCYTGYLFEDLLAGRVGEKNRELLS